MVQIIVNRKRFKMYLKAVRKDAAREVFDIIGRDRTVQISSNRPLLRGKGLKHVKPTWKVKDSYNNVYAMELFLELITRRLDELEG